MISGTTSIDELVRGLRQLNLERYRLDDEPLSHPLLEGTFLEERGIVVPYGLDENFTLDNTVVFTGQCLLKHDENPECPVTLEDIIDVLKLQDFLAKTQLPAVCMIPDSIYLDKKFLDPWFGGTVDLREIRERIERFSDLYIRVRSRVTPSVRHMRTSEIERELNAARTRLSTHSLIPNIRQVYGGRFLDRKESTHPLSSTILDYGSIMLLMPEKAGYGERNVVAFAEPDEICSVKAAQTIVQERKERLRSDTSVGLIGQIPLPPLYFPPELKKNRMYGASPTYRIHLNETDEQIRRKLLEHPEFASLAVYMSPLTDRDELDYLRAFGEKEDAVDVLMPQIKQFRSYME